MLLYSEAVAVYIDLGRFTTAAKLQKEIGELKEAENDLKAAIDAYQQAADFYAGEESSSQASTSVCTSAEWRSTSLNRSSFPSIFESPFHDFSRRYQHVHVHLLNEKRQLEQL